MLKRYPPGVCHVLRFAHDQATRREPPAHSRGHGAFPTMRSDPKAQREPTFSGRGEHDVPCPDCSTDDRVFASGKSKTRPPWSEPSGSLAPVKDHGCETCKGSGWVPRESSDDPYDRDAEGKVKRPWWRTQ